ncbi:MAG: hypothetical protein WAW37_13100 [Syntrophobacteraceae bacterium]
MPNPPKCLLLPIDGTAESLRPVEFVSRLYPGVRDVNLVLSYFVPPLSPIYSGPGVESPGVLKKRREALASREQDTRRIFEGARKMLLDSGFSEALIQEHVQQKEMTVAKHACLLADIKKVDAILVQKRISSDLEGYLRGDSHSALLRHCIASPIWFTEGEIQAEGAAVCIYSEEASLRIADHAAFMLSDTNRTITLLHLTKSLSSAISCPFSEAQKALAGWSGAPAGREAWPYLLKSAGIMVENGVEEDRIRVAIIPQRWDIAQDILSWCGANGAGIIGLGHSEPEGIWSFFKASVTRKILSDFKNMAVWVTQ